VGKVRSSIRDRSLTCLCSGGVAEDGVECDTTEGGNQNANVGEQSIEECVACDKDDEVRCVSEKLSE